MITIKRIWTEDFLALDKNRGGGAPYLRIYNK